jgi:hypothetical protein
MENSREADADSLKGVVFQLGFRTRYQPILALENDYVNETLHKALGLSLTQGTLSISWCSTFCLVVPAQNVKSKAYRIVILPVVLYES